MSDKDSQGIWIISDSTSEETVTGGKDGQDTGADYGSKPTPKPSRRRTLVRAEDLRQHMADFLEVMENIFDQAAQTSSQMQLDEIELSVEINGEGKVSLCGTGGTLGGKGAINLTFKRR